jgi:hypothetical protein
MFRYYKCRPKSHPFPVVAWLIMLFQGMLPWKKDSTSHRAMGFVDRLGNTMIIDSTGDNGVSESTVEDFQLKYKTIEFIEYEANINHGEFKSWRRKTLNKKYDQLQVLGLLIKRLFGFISFNTIGKNYRSLTCNEVFISFIVDLNLMKFHIKDPDNWDLLMTDELAEKLKEKLA